MKKIILLTLVLSTLALSGCQTAANMVSPKDEAVDSTPLVAEPEIDKEETITKKIVLSKTLNMNNEWTIIGDFKKSLTKSGKPDRIILATSAEAEEGEIQWDDSQYWTLAVITDEGAYNLFYERLSGKVYVEVSEAYVQGIPTPVVTAYIFSGSDREIRNYSYSYKEDAFVEQSMFSTQEFSTGGISNLYSTFPDPKAR